jgi:uncharacterized protein YciW
MTPEDLAPLRDQGLNDRDIHDATQVIGYFNYINRIADALGTDLEPEMPPRQGRARDIGERFSDRTGPSRRGLR